MKIEFTKYLLATNKYPLEFDKQSSEGEMTENIQNAYLYNSEADVELELGNFDNPKDYRAIKVDITYQL